MIRDKTDKMLSARIDYMRTLSRTARNGDPGCAIISSSGANKLIESHIEANAYTQACWLHLNE